MMFDMYNIENMVNLVTEAMTITSISLGAQMQSPQPQLLSLPQPPSLPPRQQPNPLTTTNHHSVTSTSSPPLMLPTVFRILPTSLMASIRTPHSAKPIWKLQLEVGTAGINRKVM